MRATRSQDVCPLFDHKNSFNLDAISIFLCRGRWLIPMSRIICFEMRKKMTCSWKINKKFHVNWSMGLTVHNMKIFALQCRLVALFILTRQDATHLTQSITLHIDVLPTLISNMIERIDNCTFWLQCIVGSDHFQPSPLNRVAARKEKDDNCHSHWNECCLIT